MNQQMVPQNISPKVIRLKLLVSRVRIVFMACGKKAEVVKMAAINPKFISKKDQGVRLSNIGYSYWIKILGVGLLECQQIYA